MLKPVKSILYSAQAKKFYSKQEGSAKLRPEVNLFQVTLIVSEAVRNALTGAMKALYLAMFEDNKYREAVFEEHPDFAQAKLNLAEVCCLDKLCRSIQEVVRELNTQKRIGADKLPTVSSHEGEEYSVKALERLSEEEGFLKSKLCDLFPELAGAGKKEELKALMEGCRSDWIRTLRPPA